MNWLVTVEVLITFGSPKEKTLLFFGKGMIRIQVLHWDVLLVFSNYGLW